MLLIKDSYKAKDELTGVRCHARAWERTDTVVSVQHKCSLQCFFFISFGSTALHFYRRCLVKDARLH